jgi:hexosaminidase
MLPRVAAVASSETAFDAGQAIDGYQNSRWSSTTDAPPQWIYVDLGETYRITRVIIRWYKPNIDTTGPAYAQEYDIQVSDDAESWTTIAGLTDGDGLVDDFTGLSGTGRYVRMYGKEPAPTGRRFSMYEFEVYGETPE